MNETRDAWEQVVGRLVRRRLVRAALVVLALLYAGAIYAPLLASDRPYVLVGIDYREYGEARRTLLPATTNLARLLREGPEEYGARRAASGGFGWEEAVAAEEEAAARRVATMQAYLAGEPRAAVLGDLSARVDAAVAAGRSGDRERATAHADAARELAGAIQTSLAARDPRRPGEGEVTLRPVRRHPLWQAIGATELFFMVLWTLVLLGPLWGRAVDRLLLGGDPTRIRRARAAKLAAVLALSLLGALAGGRGGGGSTSLESASIKAGLTSGDIVATRVVFPPLSFGFAELRAGERLRPPSWAGGAARAPAGAGAGPPEVEVLYGEPAAASPWRHLLGTDSLGRDLLVRLLWGGRISLTVGLVSAVLLVLIGTAVGAAAGYFGGWIDLVLSRVIEVVLCIPAFFLILTVVAFTDPAVVPPLVAIAVVIALVRWTGVARLARAEVLRLRELEFTLAARALGASALRTIFRHVLPNAIGPILVAGAFAVAAGILTESALSFLGLGVSHPIPSWGALATESRSPAHWWIQVFPGLLIFVTVVCYNLVGDAIRDAVDPRMRIESR
ncbi:MAG: ABC transporter permease [Planctomycetota bacterium]